MAGISSKALNDVPENKNKYNGIEKEDAFEIGIYDAQLRELDGQMGRWWQIDPKTENMEMWSPYASNYDNPITFMDPLGDEPDGCCKWLRDAANWVGDKINDIGNSAPVVWVNNNLNPVTPLAELITGKSLNSGFTESKSRSESGVQLATFLVPTAKAETIIANEVRNVVVNQIEKQALKTAEKKTVVAAAEKKVAGSTDFVVTEKGTTIPIPDGAKGPLTPQKGSGMVYQGGSGGKGMDKKVTGVRIMDANKNQGRRVNYTNNAKPTPQTVNPKTGTTISNKDPRGHIPII